MSDDLLTIEQRESRDQLFMARALELATAAGSEGEVPVGAVVVCGDKIVAEASNQPIGQCDPTAHAEIVAMRRAAQAIGNYRLVDCELFVTLEPCAMCAGAMVHSRIKRLVFGALEPKAGSVISNVQLLSAAHNNHHPDVTAGVLAEQSGKLLSDFFQQRREAKRALRDSLKNR